MTSKETKAFFRKHRRQRKSYKVPLVPTEWYSMTAQPNYLGQYENRLDEKKFTQEVRQKYFDSLYGNIYIKTWDRWGRPTDATPPETHMFIRALVGSGRYTSFLWLNLRTNQKWEESVEHDTQTYNGSGWRLMVELEV